LPVKSSIGGYISNAYGETGEAAFYVGPLSSPLSLLNPSCRGFAMLPFHAASDVAAHEPASALAWLVIPW